MLRDEGKNIKVISDDYTIQNTRKLLIFLIQES